MRSPAPAAPPQRRIIEEYLHEKGLAYPTYGGPYEGWIRPTEVSRVPTGEHFQAVRVPYESAMRTLTAHPGLAHGPVVVNDYAAPSPSSYPAAPDPGTGTSPVRGSCAPG
ncbi:hypothetical protein [Streptomyces katsurahamanus]|uniref:Uncharacterized protein n=1 Tax=Streptomyces katsurahamanus TaxID=2577098 RepID=A0ABW9NRJ3_9ACTN|nr:hypothetical protein [Streptomyces katsurahamanus]MQS35930.1 hypothetical protein [Streptomyces katsurahamanus]